MAGGKYPFHYDMPRIAPERASEIVIQASCKMRVETQFDARFAAVPNGQKRTPWEARHAKREGMAKGFPDAIIYGGPRNHGKVAFIEIKATTGLSREQTARLTEMHHAGHDVGVFRSQDTLAEWLAGKGWR